MKRQILASAAFITLTALILYGLQPGRMESPDNAAGWQPIGPEGGNIGAFAPAPDDPNDVLAIVSSSYSGPSFVFRTLNAGKSWNKVAKIDKLVNDIIRDSSNPSIIYGAAKDRFYKSVDGGKSWKFVLFERKFFTWGRMAVDPASPDHIYISGSYIYKSYDTCLAVAKSVNGGDSWAIKQVFPTSDSGQASTIALDPKKPSTVYLGGYVATDKYHARLCKSTDGGTTWEDISGPIAETPDDIAVDPVNPKNLFVGCENGLYKSTNGGKTLTKSSGNLHAHKFAFDPANPKVIYAGGNAEVFKSMNGGSSWTKYSKGLFGSVRCFALTTSGILSGTGCGVYGSADGGKTWQPSQAGIAQSDTMALAVSPSDPKSVYTSVYGLSLFYSPNGGASWEKTSNPGKEAYAYIQSLAIHPTAPHLLYAVYNGEDVEGGLYRTPDAGLKWTRILNRSVSDVSINNKDPRNLFALGYTKSGKNYISTLLRSFDGGDHWVSFPVPANVPSMPYSMACHPEDPGIVYIGAARMDHYRGVIFKTVDGCKTWNMIQYTGKSGDYPYSMALDPNNTNRILVGTPYGIYRSEDGGQTWSLRGTCKSASSIVFDPKIPGVVYAGWSNGVVRSLDGGRNWQTFNTGLVVLYVQSLALDPVGKILYAATSGGGVYKRSL